MDNDSNLEDLDTSWIEKEEKRFSFGYNSTKIQNECITCYFVYMDENLSIQKVVQHDEKLVRLCDSDFGIHNSRLLEMIQRFSNSENGTKHKFIDLLKYVLDFDVDDLPDFAYRDDPNDFSGNFLKHVSIFNDLVIEPSVFIFHPLHSLYFFYKENAVKIKSILKNNNTTMFSLNSKSTKKVHIVDTYNSVSLQPSVKKSVKTRKNI
jgi:hypothetical protein